jgi:murein DD-endopeptidase MepM/ murein hydrolase activator NlpD
MLRAQRVLLGVGVAGLLLTWALPAVAADPRLNAAEQAEQQAQAELDDLLQRISALDAEREDVDARIAELQEVAAAAAAQAQTADGAAVERIRQLYMHGSSDPGMAVLMSDSPEQAAEQARLLAFLARGSRVDAEHVDVGRVVTQADLDEVVQELEALQGRTAELQTARAEAEALVQERLAAIQVVRDELGLMPNAPVNGGIACPIGQPRSYTDTWGAPRSGGRSHKGVDILSPHGTPLYAYESGTVSRMSNSGLGGITLYLDGDSGTRYYYAHLSGYAPDIAPGQRVEAGRHLAFNGSSGNAPVPHLHFEVQPGGGGSVNPYPYARRACG